MVNRDMIIIKLKDMPTVMLPSILDSDDYIKGRHSLQYNDCKPDLMKDKDNERCGDTYVKE